MHKITTGGQQHNRGEIPWDLPVWNNKNIKHYSCGNLLHIIMKIENAPKKMKESVPAVVPNEVSGMKLRTHGNTRCQWGDFGISKSGQIENR
tara:strand:+ start:240 stop:515 length:276 start_codon:yes stop_codon:yes gene_type:complete